MSRMAGMSRITVMTRNLLHVHFIFMDIYNIYNKVSDILCNKISRTNF